MVAELTTLRDKLDEIDSQLIDQLARRLAVMTDIDAVKKAHGLPRHAPDRETSVIAARRRAAEKMSVPPDLIEDLIRRLTRESYLTSKQRTIRAQHRTAVRSCWSVAKDASVVSSVACSSVRDTRSEC